MLRTKLLKVLTYNRPSVFMSTDTQPLADKKLEHYRNLKALEEREDKPSGWDNAKPFNEIPGPKPLPVLGNMWRFVVPKIGTFHGMDFLDIHKFMRKEYGDISIFKGILGGDPMVMLFNPNDFETLFRNEGIWPIRKNLSSLQKYQTMRKDVFPVGLVAHHGEEWFQIRSLVNPILMQPRNIVQYTDKMSTVADELIDNIKYLSEQNENGEMPSDFTNELYKWALESVGVVTLDSHLGCLKRSVNKDSEPQKIINNAIQFFDLMYKLEFHRPSLWKYISTPNWKNYVSVLDFLISTNITRITQALDKIEKEKVDPENETRSVLQQLLKRDKNIAIVMSIDMMLAGIDTTGRIMGAGLYFLSRNPEQQQKLRDEARSLLPSKDGVVTKEILAKAPYLRATVKEVTRLAPIGVGGMRTTVKDLVLGGYQIPKGTDVMTANLLLCTSDEFFPRAKEFLPERSLPSAPENLSHKNANPFIFAPFGSGPRSCIGKRLATLELEVALFKIVRNFELSWAHEDMKFATALLHGIASPLKIRVKPINE